MKKNLLLLVFCLFSAGIFAQQVRLTGANIPNFQNDALQRNFYKYTVFSADVEPLLRAAVEEPATLDLRLELGSLPAVNTLLNYNRIISEGYFTTTATNKGALVSFERPAVYPFISKDLTQAALTVAKDFLYGSFEAEGRSYFIEPLWYFDKSQPRNLFVLYESSDVIETGETTCGAVEIEQEKEKLESRGGEERPDCGPPELEIAIASDYQMVEKYGSVSAVVNHNISVMNAAQANWDDEFSVPVIFNITTQWVPANVLEDPWPISNNRDVLMGFFVNWANAGGFGASVSYDLGHWRSPRIIYNPAGLTIAGAAYTNGLCTASRYGIFSENTLPACGLRTVVSHEMGHSFGAMHTTQSGTIMYEQYIGCTNTWAAVSITQINSGISSATCLSPLADCPLPAGVPIPGNLAYICENIEECYTFDDLCIATFSVSTSDPYLQVTVNGRTICLKNTSPTARISQVSVVPLDYCGESNQDPGQINFFWQVHINYSVQSCPNMQGGSQDRQRSPAGDLSVRQNSDFLTVEDFSVDLRNKSIEVYDMAGRQLLQQQGNDQLIQVPLNEFPAGVLVVRVAAGDQVVTTKILRL